MNSHYFFAAVIPDHIKEAVFNEMNRRKFPFKRFTHPEDYHITLSFIGAAEERFLQKACEEIGNQLRGEEPIRVSLTSFQTFGRQESPRILWVGTNEPSSLFRVQSIVENACKAAGFRIDERPFRPHLTTARKWAGDVSFKGGGTAPDWPSFEINEVALFETHQVKGPKYEKKWSCLLNEPRKE